MFVMHWENDKCIQNLSGKPQRRNRLNNRWKRREEVWTPVPQNKIQ
jgi:hypothetical protein